MRRDLEGETHSEEGEARAHSVGRAPASLQCDIITALLHYLLNERY